MIQIQFTSPREKYGTAQEILQNILILRSPVVFNGEIHIETTTGSIGKKAVSKAEKDFKPKAEQTENQAWLAVPLLQKCSPGQRQGKQEECQHG